MNTKRFEIYVQSSIIYMYDIIVCNTVGVGPFAAHAS